MNLMFGRARNVPSHRERGSIPGHGQCPGSMTIPLAPASIRHTLRANPVFRGLCAGGLLYFIGNAMQVMAASWLMVELTGSSFLAALVQTAVFLPMFLLSLPAGVLADVTDRRRLLVIALVAQAALVTLLTVLLLLDGPGHGAAAVHLRRRLLHGAAVAGLEHQRWPTRCRARTCRRRSPSMSIACNSARALGPSMAGFVFASWAATGCSRIAVLTALLMMDVDPALAADAAPTVAACRPSACGAARSPALRFARHSPT